MKIQQSDMCLAKVLFEDEDFLTIEVIKNEQRELQLDPDGGDRFLTMLFIKRADDSYEVWKPWS